MDQNVPIMSDDDHSAALLQRFQNAMEAQLYADATEAMLEFVAHAGILYTAVPTPDNELLAEADRCLSQCDWAGTERALLQRLALPDISCNIAAGTHMNLARLYDLLNQEAKSLRHSELATAAMREYRITNMPLVMALHSEANRNLRFGHISRASEIVAESLSLLEDSVLWNHLRAKTFVLRGKCEVHTGQLELARADLDSAFGLIQPMTAMEFAAGIRASLSECWEVRGELSTTLGDLDDAVDCWQEAAALARAVLNESTILEREVAYDLIAMADVLDGLSRALTAVDRIAEAREADAQRADIHTSLGLPAAQ
jgi:tetratricopeptide (TPR) repeat protein